jgi:uncharacterized protein (TIGR01777 family)
MPLFQASVELPVSAADAFAYHERPGALQRLLPPWQTISAEPSRPGLEVGTEVLLRGWSGWLPIRWKAVHDSFDPPRSFSDVQVEGPFASWRHVHRFHSTTSSDRCNLTDEVNYRLPLGRLGAAVAGRRVEHELTRMFAARHRTTAEDLRLQKEHPTFRGKRIAISGATGLVGRQLLPLLSVLGHQTFTLQRGAAPSASPSTIAAWSEDQANACRELEGLDAVVHLAGKPISDQRWSAKVKQEIRRSRVELTRTLCERLAKLERKPQTFVCASAIGYYGDRSDEVLDERASPGSGFLADVAQEWEAACRPAEDAGIRVVHARLGVVLSPQGGALAKLLGPAGWGLGGPVGHGNQYWSWVALDDVLGAIYWMLANERLRGPVNVTAPQPVTSREFATVLGTVLHRPAVLPTPAVALRLLLGEMADELLLASARVVPRRLLDTGYPFRFPDLESALRHLLGNPT